MVYPTKSAVLQPDGFSSVLASMTLLEHTAIFVKTESNNIHGSCVCTCIIALYIYTHYVYMFHVCTNMIYIYTHYMYYIWCIIDLSIHLSIYLYIYLSIYLYIYIGSIYYYMYCTISVHNITVLYYIYCFSVVLLSWLIIITICICTPRECCPEVYHVINSLGVI